MKTASLVLVLAVGAAAEDGVRALWNTEFKKQRAAPTAAAVPAKAPRATLSEGAALVGVTVWRLRPSSASDPTGVRLLVHESASAGAYFTPERVDAQRPIRPGDHVRIGIEAARTGYLYVFAREKYKDGSFGEPYLVFPSRRIRGGANRVRAGRSVQIPEWDDVPPYLTVKRERKDQVAEALSILISPEPLPGVVNDGAPMRLSPEQLASWEKRWGASSRTLLASESVGQPLTPAEVASGAGAELLTEDDPLPQMLYRIEAKPQDPVLITFSLGIEP